MRNGHLEFPHTRVLVLHLYQDDLPVEKNDMQISLLYLVLKTKSDSFTFTNDLPVNQPSHLSVGSSAVLQHLAVQHCAHTIFHTLDGLLQHTIQILDIFHFGGVQLATCCCLGDTRIVRHRVE